MSTKLTIKEAVEVIPVSESSLRRDIKSGKVSSEKDLQGRRRIDASELARVYGELKQDNGTPEQSDESVRDSQVNTDDTPKIITLLEGQVQDLKAQLDTATAEKTQLLELLSAEKEEKRALMPPVDEKTEISQLAAPACRCEIVPSNQKLAKFSPL